MTQFISIFLKHNHILTFQEKCQIRKILKRQEILDFLGKSLILARFQKIVGKWRFESHIG